MDVVVTFNDEEAEALVILRRMTEMTSIEDFVLKAVALYQWLLIQQTFDHTVVSMCPQDGCEGHPEEPCYTVVPELVVDKELGLEYFGGYFE